MPQGIEELIKDCGFECVGEVPVDVLVPHVEARQACEVNTCGQYNKTWACPPACGDLDYFEKEFAKYSKAYVLQTWGELEDEFDFETMMELAQTHNKRTNKLAAKVHASKMNALVLGAGKCSLCDECTYPDAPCRHEGIMHPAMEAAGLVVAESCRAAGVQYNHGKGTMSYVSCVLV